MLNRYVEIRQAVDRFRDSVDQAVRDVVGIQVHQPYPFQAIDMLEGCLLYTSDAADDLLCVDLGGRRIIKKKKTQLITRVKQ